MRQVIKQLKHGDAIPPGEPKRYYSSHGYVRLRWRVGSKQYVECYEHRLVAGAVQGRHVHHKNHQKDDNRPENLINLAPSEHTQEHHPFLWDIDEAICRYLDGASTVELSAIYGKDTSQIYHGIRARGIRMRTAQEAARRQDVDVVEFRRLYSQGVRVSAIGARLGVSSTVAHRIRRDLGLAPFPPGRPRTA